MMMMMMIIGGGGGMREEEEEEEERRRGVSVLKSRVILRVIWDLSQICVISSAAPSPLGRR
jgi:hypothetical protein